ncbi:hypothetical protein [Belnapia moabensis]|uniref:hypothetical protein n=1 Tax=Belnapia moabensis TaxID=365533 RepID=UPI0038CD1BA7
MNRANLQRDIQVGQYERAIQTAFHEAADALAARGTHEDEIAAQCRLFKAYADAYRLSLMRLPRRPRRLPDPVRQPAPALHRRADVDRHAAGPPAKPCYTSRPRA